MRCGAEGPVAVVAAVIAAVLNQTAAVLELDVINAAAPAVVAAA